MRNFIPFTFMLSVFISGCVLKSQHDETMAAYIKSTGDLSKTRQDSESCNKNLTELQQKSADLEARNQELSETNQQLAAKNKLLAEKSTDAQKEYLKLIDEKTSASKQSAWVERLHEQLTYEFRNELGSGAVKLEKDAEGSVLSLKDKALFPATAADLPAKTKDILARFSQTVRSQAEASVRTSGTHELKKMKAKSALEASSVFGVLVARQLEKNGLPPAKVQVLLKDSTEPSLALWVINNSK